MVTQLSKGNLLVIMPCPIFTSSNHFTHLCCTGKSRGYPSSVRWWTGPPIKNDYYTIIYQLCARWVILPNFEFLVEIWILVSHNFHSLHWSRPHLYIHRIYRPICVHINYSFGILPSPTNIRTKFSYQLGEVNSLIIKIHENFQNKHNSNCSVFGREKKDCIGQWWH